MEYFKQINKIPLLTADEEVDLAKQIEAGLFAEHKIIEQQKQTKDELNDDRQTEDTEPTLDELNQVVEMGKLAMTKFMESNLRLVASIANKYNRNHLDEFDKINTGVIGLAHAIRMFDYTKGYKFSTYATRWIQIYIIDAINSDSTIRVTQHMLREQDKLQRVENDFLHKHGAFPTNEQLAQAIVAEDISKMDTPPTEEKRQQLEATARKKVERIKNSALAMSAIPLDKLVGDGGTSLMDFVPGADTSDLEAEIRRLYELLSRIGQQESDMVRRSYGFAPYNKRQTFKKIGEEYGIKTNKVREIINKGLEDLRALAAQADFYG